jgi:hypothetical protein
MKKPGKCVKLLLDPEVRSVSRNERAVNDAVRLVIE